MKNMLITALFLVIFGVCHAQSPNSDTIQQTAATAKKHKHSYTRYVKSNQTFTIKLPAAMGEGYSWQLVDSTFADNLVYVKQASKNLVQSKPGSDSIQIFYFKATKPGSQSIKFTYGRPFDKSTQGKTRKKTYKVIVS